MVMKVEPLVEAVEAVQGPVPGAVLLLSPRGEPLGQRRVEELSAQEQLILVAGRYEGVDERFRLATGALEVIASPAQSSARDRGASPRWISCPSTAVEMVSSR